MVDNDRSTSLISAAMRHVCDASRLLDTSPDQSWHLAGFGPECARKACLSESWFDRLLGHDFADEVLELALALDVQAARYEVHDLRVRHPTLRRWSVESRYERTGSRSHVDASNLVTEAKGVTYAIASELWMDGRIDGVR